MIPTDPNTNPNQIHTENPFQPTPPTIPGPIGMPSRTPSFRREREAPDQRSLLTLPVLWTVAAVLIFAIFGIQQAPNFIAPQPSTPGTAEEIAPPDMQFELTAKLVVKMHGDFGSMAGSIGDLEKVARQRNKNTLAPVDALRLATVASQFGDSTDQYLELARKSKDSKVLEDADLIEAAILGKALTPEQADGLKDRHGYFGELATVQPLPKSDPVRKALTSGGMPIIIFFIAVGVLLLLVAIASLVCFLYTILNWSRAERAFRFTPPQPGGGIYLETFVVFLLSFLGMLAISSIAAKFMGPSRAAVLSLVLQWAILLTIFWPLARGLRAKDWRAQVGWHTGEGVAREIVMGLFGYLAGLPLLAGALIVTLILTLIVQQFLPEGAGANKIADLIGAGGPLELVLLFVLATVWAPIVEETIFRGGVFRHFRGRLGMVGAAFFTALLFGVMHGYAFYALAPVISIGLIFSFIREWRGSIIGPVVAHALHNATTLGIVITMFTLLK